jgi:hypothetical protein
MFTVYEVPPGKTAYHYHLCREEVFYILHDDGILRTPQGEQTVGPGDFCFFPESQSGAHKLCNASATESLVYIDLVRATSLTWRYTPIPASWAFGERISTAFIVRKTTYNTMKENDYDTKHYRDSF